MKKKVALLLTVLLLVSCFSIVCLASSGDVEGSEQGSGEIITEEPVSGEVDSGEVITEEPTSGEEDSGEVITEEPTSGDDGSGEVVTEEPTSGENGSGEVVIEDPTSGENGSGEVVTEEPTSGDDGSGEGVSEEPTSGDDGSGETSTEEPTSGDGAGGSSSPGGSSSNTIKVSFRLIGASPSSQDVDLSKGKEGYYGSVYQEWIAKKTYSIEKESSVQDLLEMVLDSKKLEYDIKDTGYGPYISMITGPKKYGSEPLEEFGNGQYTGWMYTVNGESPWDGIAYTILENGDDVLVYYTNDFRYEMEGYDVWYGIKDYDGEFLNAWLKVSKTSTRSSRSKSSKVQEEANTETSNNQDNVTVDFNYMRNAIMSKDSVMAKVLGSILEMNQQAVVNNTATVVYQTVTEPTIGSVGGEWTVMGIKASGILVDEAYFDTYMNNVKQQLTDKDGVLSDRKYTEYARVALAVNAIGEDPSNVASYNLLDNLNDFDKVTYQGVNGAIYALMALDECGYPSENREKYIDYILARQGEDGGFAYAEGGASDIDITAMALQVLANYLDNEKVRNCCNNAVAYLSKQQNENGAFVSFGIENLESTAQVLAALKKLNISNYDERFVKNSHTVLDAVMSYYVPNQGFKHVATEETVNQMATEQALLALSAIKERVFTY